MTLEERRDRFPHGELIVPRGHLILKSIYQFADSAEVYAFLLGCKKEYCSVYFQNEDICVDSEGRMSVPTIAISIYMHMKENPNIVDAYLRFLIEAGSGKCSLNQVEVC